MIDLRAHRQPVLRFLEDGITHFRRSHPSTHIGHVALYCCPWSGWVSLCLNSVAQEDQNCPDFEYVEVALYEAPSWVEEYEHAHPLQVIAFNGQVVSLNLDEEGDEAINRVFFKYQRSLLREPEVASALRSTIGPPPRLGVQLLDSAFNESWHPAGA